MSDRMPPDAGRDDMPDAAIAGAGFAGPGMSHGLRAHLAIPSAGCPDPFTITGPGSPPVPSATRSGIGSGEARGVRRPARGLPGHAGRGPAA